MMRNFGAGRLEDIYVTGNDDYFDEMIEIAGGHNLFGNVSARYPVVSAESIIKTDPQIIIDILPGMNAGEAKAAAEDWRKLGAVDAVVHGKVFCLHADFVSVPGPRFILLLEKMAVLLHPEVDWGEEEKKDDRGQRTDDRGKGTSSRLRLRKLNHYVRTKTINVGTTFGTG